MTKTEIKKVIKDFIEEKTDKGITFENVIDVMGGCYYWTEKRMIRREMVARFLDFQCRYLDGKINDKELQDCCTIFKRKIIMI